MNDKLFLSLLEASFLHAKRSRMGFQDMDLSMGQPKVLYTLNRQEGYSQKELAKVCQVEQSTMTSLLDNMEKKELIRKEKNLVSGGKRSNCIYLTDRGRELAKKVDDLVEHLENVCYEGFSQDEKGTLIRLLGKVIVNLSNDMKQYYI